MLSGNEKSNIGQSDRSNRLPGRFSFVRCEKHSDVFRTRQKSRRELQQLVQNTISTTKCSFRLVRVLESDSALHQEPGHAHLWSVSNPPIFSLGLSAPP